MKDPYIWASMNKEELFREIRPYRDDEAQLILQEMVKDPMADRIIEANFPNMSLEEVKNLVRGIRDIDSFQKVVIYHALVNMLNKSSDGLSCSGVENLTGDHFTFISNHRDITLDPSLLNYALVLNGHSTAEVAIGDNLLQNEWVKEFVKINKSFIVKRNLPPRELVKASHMLSQYIYYTAVERAQTVWIAQREGRAKDGNDKTYPGVLNMLAMAAQGDLAGHFMKYCMTPVVISYELDPCDVDKVWSLYSAKYLGGYVKSEKEDQLAMQKGIEGRKGHIHIHFGKMLTEEIEKIKHLTHKNELINTLCTLIDREIILNYKNWPTNYIAFDLYNGGEREKAHYTDQQKLEFVQTIDEKISKLDGDQDILRRMLYNKYANPVINKKVMQERLKELK